ncbi:MAG: ABC transporter substrate-binding protein [Dehalococcoidia bacterium]|nr:ABC transporter substrate-binding protein [Dehalococcoidia bacterium]
MKSLALILLAIVVTIASITACNPVTPPGPGVITDDHGRTVDIAETPERIVSLAPSITEILFALDLGNKVVGVTDRCDYPAEVQDKPKMGGYFSTSLEAIIAQDPDIVFSDGHDPVGAQLEALGITMVVLQPKDIAGILLDIELVGEITGKEAAAEELVAEMERRIGAVSARTAGVERPTVFYVIDASDPSKPWTVGFGSFVNTLIALASGENMVKVSTAYLQISLEEVIASDPEMIIGPTSHGTSFLPDLGNLPVWKEMTAVKEGNIYQIEDDLISRPGPRIVEGLEEIAKIIHPELFP